MGVETYQREGSHCGQTVMPSEYYREVFGGEMADACEFESIDQANEILGLMMRHWNDIAGTLFKGEVYVPLFQGTSAGQCECPQE
jgi:yecA family protein